MYTCIQNTLAPDTHMHPNTLAPNTHIAPDTHMHPTHGGFGRSLLTHTCTRQTLVPDTRIQDTLQKFSKKNKNNLKNLKSKNNLKSFETYALEPKIILIVTKVMSVYLLWNEVKGHV